MTDTKIDTLAAWPKKTRELHSHHFDSTMWNDFTFRDDDVFIGTYAKSGTTWTQQIVSQLIFAGAEDINVPEVSPWLDLRVPPREIKLPALEAQTHRRFIKTHLPVDALRVHEKAKYIYIGRDGRDVMWSMYNHHANANATFYEVLNGPGLVGDPILPPPEDIREYFLTWLNRDGYPFWSFWENIHSWWQVRKLDNMLLLHFSDLKADLPGNIRKIADFLDIEVDPAKWDAIVHHCTFDYMKEHAHQAAPLGGAFWEGGAKTFINKGVNGRWRDILSAEDNARYEAMAVEKLGAACAHWLKTGEQLA